VYLIIHHSIHEIASDQLVTVQLFHVHTQGARALISISVLIDAA
jgi:hypothetical protein